MRPRGVPIVIDLARRNDHKRRPIDQSDEAPSDDMYALKLRRP
jgi:hypothetical protein